MSCAANAGAARARCTSSCIALQRLKADMSAKELKAQKKAQKQAQRAAKKETAPPTAPAAAPAELKFQLFGNLEPQNSLEDLNLEDVHHATLNLALKYRKGEIVGSCARAKAMLECFALVLGDYAAKVGGSARTFTVHLNKQIEVLKMARALGVAMGNAIRWLKQQIAALDPELEAAAANDHIQQLIAGYIREQIDVADKVIVDSTIPMIKQGARILTYAYSEVVYLTIKAAHERGLDISVVVVDSNPLFEGKKLATALAKLGIPVQYALLHALPYLVDDTISCVLVGAHAMTSNGQLISRVGTSLVAMATSVRHIPFLVLCETIKFSDRVQLDALQFNELIPSKPNYIFYDLTESRYVSKVVTEIGALPASSVPVILREYKQLQ